MCEPYWSTVKLHCINRVQLRTFSLWYLLNWQPIHSVGHWCDRGRIDHGRRWCSSRLILTVICYTNLERYLNLTRPCHNPWDKPTADSLPYSLFEYMHGGHWKEKLSTWPLLLIMSASTDHEAASSWTLVYHWQAAGFIPIWFVMIRIQETTCQSSCLITGLGHCCQTLHYYSYHAPLCVAWSAS